MLNKFIKPVYAHCDVPCGIYETDTLRHAAETCLRMIEKIEALGKIDDLAKNNNFIRMVNTKEEHAQKVKDQVYILWSDYFKPEHLGAHPELHETLWQTAKQASEVKHHVDRESCELLLQKVSKVEALFNSTK